MFTPRAQTSIRQVAPSRKSLGARIVPENRRARVESNRNCITGRNSARVIRDRSTSLRCSRDIFYLLTRAVWCKLFRVNSVRVVSVVVKPNGIRLRRGFDEKCECNERANCFFGRSGVPSGSGSFWLAYFLFFLSFFRCFSVRRWENFWVGRILWRKDGKRDDGE